MQTVSHPMRRPWAWFCVLTLLNSAVLPASAADAIHIELNKFEPREEACRAYLVFKNGAGSTFTEFKLDLVMFDPDGIIARRLALDAAPLRADKTSVKLFDIEGLACAGIARILINDVLDCRDAGGEHADCIDLVTSASRNDVPLVK